MKYWYLIVLFLAAIVINENLIQWAIAVKVGGYTLATGFDDAFKFFNLPGYLLSSVFRLLPYAALGIILVTLSKTKRKNYVGPVFIGGLIGILSMILWGLWVSQRPLYTDEHASSTTAIAFLIIPFYAGATGALGASIFAGVYSLIQYVLRKR